MVTTKAICLEKIIQIWDDGLQTHFNSIGAKCETKCRWRRPCGGYHYVQMHSGEFDLHDHHNARCQFMQTPRKPHLDAVRRILRYIKHTLQCGIFYETKSQLQVHGYMDANWVGNVLDKRSSSGFMFSFGSGDVNSLVEIGQNVTTIFTTTCDY